MRLIDLPIQEPLPGMVLPEMTAEQGPEEAARRYRAIAITTLRQLRGLRETTLRIIPDPVDANEAIRFWLLPRLADHWEQTDQTFRSSGWEISFDPSQKSELVSAQADILCPFLSARWIHTALVGIERGTHRITGPSLDGGQCFHAQPFGFADQLETRELPPLPVIKNTANWEEALQSPLGPALKKAWKQEA